MMSRGFRSAMKRKTMDRDVSRSCLGETSHRSSEVMGNDPILEAKHKIFLSHSGAQKEIVDHLCKALEDRFHYPFFDKRHASLPKGERFPELIVRAAEQCEMFIVVVSDEYFMSKWPMIELSAFVQAHKLHQESKSSTNGPKIFPLFYGLSVDDVGDASTQKKWFEKWETFAEADPRNRIIVSDWKYALDVLRSFNGLSYDMNLKDIVAYEEQIVSCVCKSISPDIKWDDSHVQGKSTTCEVIDEKIEGIGVSRKYHVKVVGLHGVGGIGKTTTCKILCNELLNKYEGQVCHIEFPSGPSSGPNNFLQEVLRKLTSKSEVVINLLNEGECKDILCKSLFKQRTFLAIDNVSDNHQSIQLAKTMLELPYHMDSLVVVTARSQSVLDLLGIDGDACLEMLDLREADAVRLFLQHAVGGKEFFGDEEKRNILTCVSRCYFSKGDGQGRHYHPLALQSLGLQLGCHGANPSLWVKHLPRVRNFNYLPGGNPVFDILRSGFDLLSEGDRTLFMDVGYFLYPNCYPRRLNTEQLYSVHMQDEEEMRERLEHLKQKGLLQDVDLRSKIVTMHDLYLEFAELEAKGSFNDSTNLKNRMWVHIVNGDLAKLKCKPNGGCWDNLIRLTIEYREWVVMKHGQTIGQIGSLEGIKWDYFSNVEVLHLWGVLFGQGALNMKGLVCLRALRLYNVRYLNGIEGLDELKNLTHITCQFVFEKALRGIDAHFVGRLPVSLNHFKIYRQDMRLEYRGRALPGVGVVLGSDLLAQCHNLIKLCLDGVQACSLDLSNCWSLESVSLSEILKLQTVSGLTTCKSSSLRSLVVCHCHDLVDIPGIDHLIGLKKLHIEDCPLWEVPILLALTKLQVLKLLEQETLADFIPCQLQELCWTSSQSGEGLNLHGFNQLEVLDLNWSVGLTSLAELEDLPALRRLNLGCCQRLMRLPDLCKSRNLQELNLAGCFALELHERDIQMLGELPLLLPLPFVFRVGTKGQSFRLDLHRGKVLVHQSRKTWDSSSWELWRAGEWEERDVGPPPIRIGQIGPFQIGTDSDSMQYGTESHSAEDGTESDLAEDGTDSDLTEYGTDSDLTEMVEEGGC